MHKKIDLIIGKILFSLSLLIYSSTAALASDITIEGYITGGLTLALNGDYETGINTTPIEYPFTETTTSWLGDNNVDYIDFVDDTGTPGFYLTMSITDFTYSGPSQSQGPLTVDHMKIIGNLSGSTPIATTKGYDDPDYNLSILPSSCGGSTVDKFSLHSNFTSSQNNYTLTPSNSPQTILTSTSDCLAVGHLRFDKITLTYPANSAPGTYSATVVLSITDGTP